jgi:hypothetical protein
MSIEIPLSQGLVAIIDDADALTVGDRKWYAEWSKSARTFYAAHKSSGKKLYMHRVLLGLTDPKVKADHEDHNGLNNRRQNLRPCNNSNNCANFRATRGGTSVYKGVTWDKRRQRWAAQITVNYKHKGLGAFHSEHDAARAYNEAAVQHFGEFAFLNPIQGETPCLQP